MMKAWQHALLKQQRGKAAGRSVRRGKAAAGGSHQKREGWRVGRVVEVGGTRVAGMKDGRPEVAGAQTAGRRAGRADEVAAVDV